MPADRSTTNPLAASRRAFLKTTAAALSTTAVTAAVPTILHAADKAESKLPRVGEGAHTYEVTHDWGQLPSDVVWGDTHGVAIDASGLIYMKHRSPAEGTMDAIVVFDPDGKCVRSFGKEYHGGGHGIDIRKEGGTSCIRVRMLALRSFPLISGLTRLERKTNTRSNSGSTQMHVPVKPVCPKVEGEQ
jgi:hypothetical protein